MTRWRNVGTLEKFMPHQRQRLMRRIRWRRRWHRAMRLLFCSVGWHRNRFHHRAHLVGPHWTRYDRCTWCGEMTARGETL